MTGRREGTFLVNLNFDEEIKKEKRKKLIKTSLIWLGEIVFVIVLAFFIIHFCFRRTTTIGSAMEPTLYNGQEVFINTRSYMLFSPKREDVIAFYEKDKQEGEEEPLIAIRRVIACPGEKIKISDGKIWVDGTEYISKYTYPEIATGGIAEQELTCAENEYFVLSDTRSNTDDSRSSAFGMVNESQIIGKVSFRLKPFSRVNRPEQKSNQTEEGKK